MSNIYVKFHFRIVSNNGYSITSISYRNQPSKIDTSTSVLLVNALPNYLLLYRLNNNDANSLKLRKRVCIKQSEHSIRSTFCPISHSLFKKLNNNSACLACTGSEDFCVYIYDMESEDKSLINKLQGHLAPVKDVAFNYDQTFLASGDLKVNDLF